MASIFKGFFLQIPGGDSLSLRDQDEAIRFVLDGIRHYPRAARELRVFLDEELTAEEISPATLRVVRELGQEWLKKRIKKERG